MERDYYTASEAQRQLGLSKASFHRWVKEGRIPKFTPPGRKQSVYPKKDIDTLVRSMNVLFEQNDRFVFSKSTLAEQEQEMIIGIHCFGQEFITPLAERIGFQHKSEFTFWSLKVDGRVVGYISMFRFLPDFLDNLLTGRSIEREITVNKMLPFVRLEPMDIYIDVLAMDPDIEAKHAKPYAAALISRFAAKILQLKNNGYIFRTFYTVTATAEGDNLVREVGFKLLEGKSIAPGRIAYEYPMDDEGLARLKYLSRRGSNRHEHSRAENQR